MQRIVFVGNCQIQVLADLYRRFSDRPGGEHISYLPSHEQLTDARMETLGKADIIVEQQLDLPPPANIDRIALRAERHPIPLLGGAFLWPFAGNPHPLNESLWFMPQGPYDAEIGDGYLNRLIARGVPPSDAVEQYLALDVGRARNLDRLFEIIVERQRTRDAACGYQFADFICERFREEPMFRTPHHPDLRLTLNFAAQFFQRVGTGRAASERLNERVRVTPFPRNQLPIHPAVAQHFRLQYADAESRYCIRNEGYFTFADYALRYMTCEWNRELAEGIALSWRDPEIALAKIEAGLEHSPESAEGWFSYADALRRLGRPADAEMAARRAVAIDPTDGRFPYGLAHALAALDRLDEAAQAAEHAVTLDPFNQHFLRLSANFAMRRGRPSDAEDFTRRAISLAPEEPHLYHFLGNLLIQQGRFLEAAEPLLRASQLAPEVAGVHLSLSQALARSNRIPEAIEVAQRAATLDPDSALVEAHLNNLLAQPSEQQDQGRKPLGVTRAQPRHPAALTTRQGKGVSEMEAQTEVLQDLREVVMQFESLGGTGHGCEFGIFQRHSGAEPLGLLRWADLSHHHLTQALNAHFSGVGEPDHTEIFLPNNDGKNEWWSRDKRYWMAMRTFIIADVVPLERARDLILKRLCFLREKMLLDLSAAEKIFVYKNLHRNLTHKELAALYCAVRSYGKNTLLYIRYADKDHPHETVVSLAPGLLVGALDHFSYSPTNESLGAPNASFLAICQAALRLLRCPAGGDQDPETDQFIAALDKHLASMDLPSGPDAELDEVSRLHSDNSLSLRRLGGVAMHTGDLSGAEVAFRRAIELGAGADAHIELSDCLVRQGRMTEALSEIKAATHLEPGRMAWQNRLALLLLQAGHLAEAEIAARAAIEQAPESASFHDTLAIVLQRLGRNDDVVMIARRAAELGPTDVPRQIRLAGALLQARRPLDAETVVQRAVTLAPEAVEAYDLLSDVLARQGRWKEAVAAAQRAAELRPGDVGRQQRIARAMIQAGDFAEAERVLRAVGTLNSGRAASHQHHLLGIVLQHLGQLEEGLQEARCASEMEPNDPDRRSRVVSLLMATDRLDEAERVAQVALAAHPEFVPLQRMLQSIFVRRSQAANQEQTVIPAPDVLVRRQQLVDARLSTALRYFATKFGRSR